jgi:hypothetical protein
MFKEAASKAAAEDETGSVPISPTRPKRAKTCSFPKGYVEDFGEARMTLGEGRVSARRRWAGAMRSFSTFR